MKSRVLIRQENNYGQDNTIYSYPAFRRDNTYSLTQVKNQ